jgi:hypothetical protein
MTKNDGRREYAEAMRGRYLSATKKEKGKILDEFIQVTGYQIKAAIRLLRSRYRTKGRGRGRPRKYDEVIIKLLSIMWEAI